MGRIIMDWTLMFEINSPKENHNNMESIPVASSVWPINSSVSVVDFLPPSIYHENGFPVRDSLLVSYHSIRCLNFPFPHYLHGSFQFPL